MMKLEILCGIVYWLFWNRRFHSIRYPRELPARAAMATRKAAITARAIAAGVRIRFGTASRFNCSRIASFAVVVLVDESP
jgi:hypothetical protein